MANRRMMPPAVGGSISINGRTYTCVAGSIIDVPDFDANVLEANGWITASQGGVGTTAARPINPPKGTMFHDATLGYSVVHDGKVWRNPTSGASV